MVVAAVYQVPCAIFSRYEHARVVRHYLSIMIPCFVRDFESHRTTTAYRYSVSASHFFFELLISQARGSEENKAAIPESKFFQKSLS